MTITRSIPRLFSGGVELDTAPDKFGILRDSSAMLGDGNLLREAMTADGYLLLPGALDRVQVMNARRAVAERLLKSGHLDCGYDPMLCIASPTYNDAFLRDAAIDNPALHRLLYDGAMMAIFHDLLGGDVRHFDYTWFRAVAPGKGTPPHCDSVYMNRGTSNLFTAWTPIGDVSFETGGLMILEGSHRNQRLRETYCKRDVDSYCENREGKAGMDAWARGNNGVLSKNAAHLRDALSGRWLTSEFNAGDVLIFSIFTVHASLDNQSRSIRLSSDSRYQLASEAADERWIGENPIAHSSAAKRGRIC